jgi:hypothetical protein
MRGDSTEALSLFADGLQLASQSAQQVQTVSQTFTLRYVERGLTLSQILGVDYLLTGQVMSSSSTNALVSFFDWYLTFTIKMGDELDRSLQIPYVSARGCRGASCRQIPRVSTSGLEEQSVDLSISALRNLSNKFVRVLPDRTNMYSTIGVPTYLRALSYLLGEVAEDLRYSLYAESYVCQAARMDQLAQQIQSSLNLRQNITQDAIRLNRFSLVLNDILNKLDNNSCY